MSCKLSMDYNDYFRIDVVDECVKDTLHIKDKNNINNPSIIDEKESESPKQELKQLPSHLKHAFLGEDHSFPVIISSHLTLDQEEKGCCRFYEGIRRH